MKIKLELELEIIHEDDHVSMLYSKMLSMTENGKAVKNAWFRNAFNNFLKTKLDDIELDQNSTENFCVLERQKEENLAKAFS